MYRVASIILFCILSLTLVLAPERVERKSVLTEAAREYRDNTRADYLQQMKERDREVLGDRLSEQIHAFRELSEQGARRVYRDSTGAIKVER